MFEMDQTFTGGVFSKAIAGGRSGAEIELKPTHLEAVTIQGQRFTLPYRECQLEQGGSSGRMIFCRNPDRSLTIFCEAKNFLKALESAAGGDLLEQLAQMKQQGSSLRWSRWLTFWIVLILLLGSGVVGYFGILWGARAAVTALPVSVDQQLGKVLSQSEEFDGLEVNVPEVQDAIQKMMDRLTPHAGMPEFEYHVKIIHAPIINAFALPGGYLVVYTGLLEAAANPEQVAGILAHEMGHVQKRHSLGRIGQSIGVMQGLALLLGDANVLLQLGGDLLSDATLNSYSRLEEAEADAEAVRILQAAQIDPEALASFFEQLRDQHDHEPQVPAWMSSHPSHEDRIKAIKNLKRDLPKANYFPIQVDWNTVRKQLKAAPAEPPAQ